MEEGETASINSKRELRKQKLMEYLAAKGRLKLPNTKTYHCNDYVAEINKPDTSALKVKGKENKAPDNTLRYEGTKVQTSTTQATKPPTRRAFCVTESANVKGSILTRQQNAKPPCNSNSGQGQSERKKQNVVLAGVSSVNTKSNLNAGSNIKKQTNTIIQPSGRTSSNAAVSGPKKTVSVRLSLGPMVKTKTGLIPAVTQPRNTKFDSTYSSATTASTTTISAGNKGRFSTSSSVSLSRKSGTAQRKTLPNTVSFPARAGVKVQTQNICISKTLLSKHALSVDKSQLSNGEVMSVQISKRTAAPMKPEGKEKLSKTNKSAGEPTDKFLKQKSEGGGVKNGKPCKPPNQISLMQAGKTIPKAVSGQFTKATVANLGGKTKTCKGTQSMEGHSSAKAPLPQTAIKRTGATVVSQTVPQPIRTISRTGQNPNMKTPKASVRVFAQTEGKKMTAAQEERMKKLKEWREAKGICYKRPPMPVKPQVRRTVAVPQPFWTTMKEEDEAHSLIFAVDRSLADCVKLLGEGCPPDQVKVVLSRLPPVSKKFAKYWICQVRLMEQEGNLDVLPMFEEAVSVVLEPVDELRTVVFEILKKKDEIQASVQNEEEDLISTAARSPERINNPMMTPKPTKALICGEKGYSSVVKYKITATPGGPPCQQQETTQVDGQEVRFFTPVRRSVRIERASLRYPASLQERDLCVTSYSDLISKEDKGKSAVQEGSDTSPCTNDTPMYIYRPNDALQDKVCVQLVCD
ncbi:cytoskeleton-associated protein 2-like [Echeneis naucrates]|uniref:Cytoskeleton-associated protein 2-like n=1 Tax=Echeneis naucrates TaxID=173247 RepID=A0A665UV07_ECHNA|nr:cytoskeleton-associated protein 2-like [Echeneis naucrates]